MSIPLYPDAYEDLVQDDITWLVRNTDDSLERKHIIDILRYSVREYKARGYMELMMENEA